MLKKGPKQHKKRTGKTVNVTKRQSWKYSDLVVKMSFAAT